MFTKKALLNTIAIIVTFWGCGRSDDTVKKNADESPDLQLTSSRAPRLTTTILTNASAPSYPAARAIDGRTDTVWMASKTTSANNNTAWVELSLKTPIFVSSLNWKSANGNSTPSLYPASGPSRFKVLVTSDGKTWTEVYEANGATMLDGRIEIGRPILKMRFNVSKVNDGSGWALSFREIWLEGRQGSEPICSLILGPTDNYKAALSVLGTGPKTVCLKGGSYAGPLKISNARDINIVAYQGIPLITSATSTNQPVGAETATFVIEKSTNITLTGLSIYNSYHVDSVNDPDLTNKAISRALQIVTSSGIKVLNCNIHSEGKQTLQINQGVHSFKSTFIKGFYFLIDARASSTTTFDQVTLYNDFTMLPRDAHSVLWVMDSDLVFNDLSIITRSGRGLISGVNPDNAPTKRVVKLQGITKVFGLTEWVQIHPNYRNIRLNLHQTYPALTTYFQNPFNGGGPSQGTLTCFYGNADVLIKCE